VVGITAALLAPAQADPTLTAEALTQGFSLTLFADQFPNTGFCCGPLGVAFPGGGKVAVADYAGHVRVFPSGANGQHAPDAPVTSTWGSNDSVGLARSGNFLYLTRQFNSSVERLNLDGSFHSTVVTNLPAATGIATNLATGRLYVSGADGIWDVDPVANTKTLFKTGIGFVDGLSVSADGTVVYAEAGQHIFGFKTSDGSQVWTAPSLARAPWQARFLL
jgi:hypothetical protein